MADRIEPDTIELRPVPMWVVIAATVVAVVIGFGAGVGVVEQENERINERQEQTAAAQLELDRSSILDALGRADRIAAADAAGNAMNAYRQLLLDLEKGRVGGVPYTAEQRDALIVAALDAWRQVAPLVERAAPDPREPGS